MVDLLISGSGNFLLAKRLADRPSEIRQALDILERKFQGLFTHQKKPVSAPGHVTENLAVVRHINFNVCGQSVAGNVVHRDLAVGVQDGAHGSHRRLDAVCTGLDSLQE